ncbi:unnamed protein product [Prorocentrum cordatum]|uniref:Uncharacterized protein n=1 Tax=Prorocentrum cordatum TaxID=2364126 RepID=A0ABN9SGI9_9DINO|nr:unnamed protein product [Polarella glacialis]
MCDMVDKGPPVTNITLSRDADEFVPTGHGEQLGDSRSVPSGFWHNLRGKVKVNGKGVMKEPFDTYGSASSSVGSEDLAHERDSLTITPTELETLVEDGALQPSGR